LALPARRVAQRPAADPAGCASVSAAAGDRGGDPRPQRHTAAGRCRPRRPGRGAVAAGAQRVAPHPLEVKEKTMIRDKSYTTVRYGLVRSYAGYEVLGEPGSRVLRVGHPPLGTAEFITRPGGIVEFREADLGTREFELRVLDRMYAEGEISYAEFGRSMRERIKI